VGNSESFAQLRELLTQNPSRKLWNKIWRLASKVVEPEDEKILVDYAITHMDLLWPDELRVTQPDWWKSRVDSSQVKISDDIYRVAREHPEMFKIPYFFRLARRYATPPSDSILQRYDLEKSLWSLAAWEYRSDLTILEFTTITWKIKRDFNRKVLPLIQTLSSNVRSIDFSYVLVVDDAIENNDLALKALLYDPQGNPRNHLERLRLRHVGGCLRHLQIILNSGIPIKSLDFSDNCLSPEDAEEISKLPGLARLEYLNLHTNALGMNGRDIISNSPYMQHLRCRSGSYIWELPEDRVTWNAEKERKKRKRQLNWYHSIKDCIYSYRDIYGLQVPDGVPKRGDNEQRLHWWSRVEDYFKDSHLES